MAILQDTLSETAMLEAIARLTAENEILKAKAAARATGRLSMKVTEKGGLSVYGLGRFPVTLYRSQWDTLLKASEAIAAFIVAHADELATKD